MRKQNKKQCADKFHLKVVLGALAVSFIAGSLLHNIKSESFSADVLDSTTEEQNYSDTYETEEKNYSDDPYDDGTYGTEEKNYSDDSYDGSNSNTQDVTKPLNDIQKQMQRSEKELSKQYEKQVKHLERVKKQLEQSKKRIDKSESKDIDFGDVSSDIKQDIENTETLSNIVSELDSKLKSEISEVNNYISNLSSSSTWEQIDLGWLKLRKLQDTNWLRLSTITLRVMVIEMKGPSYDYEIEKARLVAEYERLDIDLDDEIGDSQQLLESTSKFIEQAEEIDEEAASAIKTLDGIDENNAEAFRDAMDEFQYLREDIDSEREDIQMEYQDIDWQLMWESLESAWENIRSAEVEGDFLMEVEQLFEELAEIKDLVSGLEKMVAEFSISELEKPVSELVVLVEKGTKILEEMKELDESEMGEYWEKLDKVGRFAEDNMEKIRKAVEKNSKYREFLEEAVGSEKVEMLMDFSHDNEGKGGFEDDWNTDQYGSDDKKNLDRLASKIKEEAMAEVMRQVSDSIIAELAPILGDSEAENIVTRILNKMNIFGEKGSELLGSYAAVSSKMGEIDDSKFNEKLKDLIKKANKVIPVPSLEDDFLALIEEIVAAGSEDSDSLASKLENLLNQNDELSVKGEEAYQFKDVKFESDDWYFDYVIPMKEEGIVSGYKDENGQLTGEFKPANNVTIAEALKMAYEGSGKGGAEGSSASTGAHGHWAEKYVKKAEEEGLSELVNFDNIERAATREEVMVIVIEVFSLLEQSNDCLSPFNDYQLGRFICHAQSANGYGIFTGVDGQPILDPSRLINRAEVSKVIGLAMEVYSTANFIEELNEIN